LQTGRNGVIMYLVKEREGSELEPKAMPKELRELLNLAFNNTADVASQAETRKARLFMFVKAIKTCSSLDSEDYNELISLALESHIVCIMVHQAEY